LVYFRYPPRLCENSAIESIWPLAKDIDVLEASLQAAEANYERVLYGPRPEENAIGEAGVGVAAARAEEARAALDRINAMQVGVSITLAQRLVRNGWLSSAIRASPTPY
jgi:hypothetical protein